MCYNYLIAEENFLSISGPNGFEQIPSAALLDQLIAADEIGQNAAAIRSIVKQYARPLGQLHHVRQAYERLSVDEDIFLVDMVLNELASKPEEEQVQDLAALAAFLDVGTEDMAEWYRLGLEKKRAQWAVYGTEEEWKATMAQSGIKPVDLASFPESSEEPMLVFVGADWCDPCHIIRPTFAKVAPLVNTPGTPLYYGEDPYWRMQFGLKKVPQLVLFTPDGNLITADAGASTKELVDNIRGLLALDESQVTNNSTLVCEDGVCRVE